MLLKFYAENYVKSRDPASYCKPLAIACHRWRADSVAGSTFVRVGMRSGVLGTGG